MTLRVKLTLLMLAVALVLGCSAAFLAVLFPARMDALATRGAQNRATGVATMLASSVMAGLDFDDHAAMNDTLNSLKEVPDAMYALVQGQDGHTLASWHEEAVPKNAVAPLYKGVVEALSTPNGNLQIAKPFKTKAGVQGTLVIGFSLAELQADKTRNRLTGGVIALVMMVMGVGLSLLVGFTLARPVAQLARMTADVVRTGDLTQHIELLRNDELGTLAASVGQIVKQQRTILARLHNLISNITGVVRRVTEAGIGVSLGAQHIVSRVENTSHAAGEMLDSLQVLGKDVDALERNAENSSAALIQMAASNKEVAGNVQTMATSAKITSVAVERMASSISEIAQSIEQLNTTINETSISVQRMDSAIVEVERNTKETARLGEKVAQNAEIGVEALQKTLQGIDNIKDSASAAAAVIMNLGMRISEIGAILRVIDEVAAQTKLLSLNAAIIAAQAGEHGRGFSVVADQIKELAQRTGASTREISGLITGIQEESRNATMAMGIGVTNVDVGVRLGNEAADALEKISQSANESTAMIRKISLSTIDQSRGSKQITTAIERIAQAVAHISNFSLEQARGAEQIIANSKNMDMLTEQVRRSSDEQSQGSRQVIDAIESINLMIGRLGTAQKDQRDGAQLVQHNVDDIRAISTKQMGALHELDNAIASLGVEAHALDSEISKYKV